MTSASCCLCKYIWEVVVDIVLTIEGCLELDIGLKTLYSDKSIESMIRIMWNTKTMWQQKVSRKPDCLLALTNKEAKYLHALLFCD